MHTFANFNVNTLNHFLHSPQKNKKKATDLPDICAETTMAERRGLFGGAIEIDLQKSFVDVSNVRQVPDHQEVFIDQDSECSFIVELLEFETSLESDTSAIKHYFNDLAEANEATENLILSDGLLSGEAFISSLDGPHCKLALIGKQRAGKYRTRPDMEVDEIYIVLLLVRLANVGTDLLISMNIPNSALQAVNSGKPVEEHAAYEWEGSIDIAHLVSPVDDDSVSQWPEEKRFSELLSVARTAANSLTIKDWTLFK